MITLPFYPGLKFKDAPRAILTNGKPRFCHEGQEGQHKVVKYDSLGICELWVKTTHGYAIHDQVI
ncbi:hypothetical protein M0R72_15285 [Candidatus Pacearchaeota archaeon]|jgi:hypothetical protein|nr:hypothetical protein [Candidatus Pacearchaeota archaeon]